MTETRTAAVLVHASEDGNAVLARQFDTLSDMAIFVAEMELKRGEYVVVDGEILMKRFNDGVLVLEPPMSVREGLSVVAPRAERKTESVFAQEREYEEEAETYG